MKKFGLILVIFVAAIILTGCCCPTCSPVSQNCSLTITASYWVWGTIYVNGQSTGQYIDFEINQSETVYNLICNQIISVWIVDPCGVQSHTETIFITPGSNYLYFAYWKNKDKQNDFHQR